MRCDKCGSNKIVPYMPMTGWECTKCGDKDCNKATKGHAVLSKSNDGLKRLVIAMLQEIQDKDLTDCINDKHLNLDHHVHPTVTVGEMRAAAKDLGITEF